MTHVTGVRLDEELLNGARQRARAMANKMGVRVTSADVIRLALREHLAKHGVLAAKEPNK